MGWIGSRSEDRVPVNGGVKVQHLSVAREILLRVGSLTTSLHPSPRIRAVGVCRSFVPSSLSPHLVSRPLPTHMKGRRG